MSRSNYQFINDMLFDVEVFLLIPADQPQLLSIYFHSSIMEKLVNTLHKLKLRSVSGVFEHNLQIGGKCFDMRLTNVKLESWLNEKSIVTLIQNSQVSFPWEECPTLFINKKSFSILQQFIAIHKLEMDILKIEEQPGITVNDDMIKVVTFNQSVKELDIIDKFKKYLGSKTNCGSKYYYMTYAFPWQQTYMLKHFEISIDDELHAVILITLNHLANLEYENKLDIFDLLMMRFALCDYRNPSISCIIKYEIDFMIKREFLKYIKNNHLDLDQYIISNNCMQKDVLCGYLIYEFQNYFETIKINPYTLEYGTEQFKTSTNIKITIYLAHEFDVLSTLKHKSNIDFDIVGRNYDQMSLSLFLDLIECHNVRRISLDTNYRWIKNACKTNRSIPKRVNRRIALLGQNTYNFIEDFVSSLKDFSHLEIFDLVINCGLNDYRIFDSFKLNSLEFMRIKVNSPMIDSLLTINLTSKISFFECTFEVTRHSWALLNKSKKFIRVEMLEDQITWQSLFELISDELINSNLKEFRFNDNTKLFIKCEDQIICLTDYIFTLDEVNKKVEICTDWDNQMIDLYYLKFSVPLDDKSDYDFYQ